MNWEVALMFVKKKISQMYYIYFCERKRCHNILVSIGSFGAAQFINCLYRVTFMYSFVRSIYITPYYLGYRYLLVVYTPPRTTS